LTLRTLIHRFGNNADADQTHVRGCLKSPLLDVERLQSASPALPYIALITADKAASGGLGNANCARFWATEGLSKQPHNGFFLVDDKMSNAHQ